MYNASVRAWVWDWTTITSWDRNWKGKKSSFIGRKPFFFLQWTLGRKQLVETPTPRETLMVSLGDFKRGLIISYPYTFAFDLNFIILIYQVLDDFSYGIFTHR